MHFKCTLVLVLLMCKMRSACACNQFGAPQCRMHLATTENTNSNSTMSTSTATPCQPDVIVENATEAICSSEDITNVLQFFVWFGAIYKKLEVWLVVDQEVSVHQIPLSNLSLRDNKWHTLDIGVASSTSASSGQELTVQLDDFTIWKQSAFDWMVNASRLGIVVKASGTFNWILPGRRPCNDIAPKGRSISLLLAPVQETEDKIAISEVRTSKKIEGNSSSFVILLSVGCACVLFMSSTVFLALKILKQKRAAGIEVLHGPREDLYPDMDHIFYSSNHNPEYANMPRKYIPNPQSNNDRVC